MNVHITLTGLPAGVVALLALTGLYEVLRSARGSLSDRYRLTLRPLRVSRRPFAPGRRVSLADGRSAVVVYTVPDKDVQDAMAVVQPYDEDEQLQQPEFVLASLLTPEKVPA